MAIEAMLMRAIEPATTEALDLSGAPLALRAVHGALADHALSAQRDSRGKL